MRFAKWIHYFQSRKQFSQIDWAKDDSFTQSEVKVLLKPLQQCQIGENSEGENLIRLAEKHVAQKTDKSYAIAIRLFIKEEQQHAKALEKFLGKHNLSTVASHPIDTAFTFVRRLYNLEICIYTLLTAEIAATFFYQAAKKASKSELLESVCKQILRDEAMHLMFQCDILSEIKAESSWARWQLGQAFFKTLFLGTLGFVWLQYGKVFKAGGFGFKRYIQKMWQLYSQCQKRVQGTAPLKIQRKMISPQMELVSPIA